MGTKKPKSERPGGPSDTRQIVTLSLDRALWAKIVTYAEREKRTQSSVVDLALQAYITAKGL